MLNCLMIDTMLGIKEFIIYHFFENVRKHLLPLRGQYTPLCYDHKGIKSLKCKPLFVGGVISLTYVKPCGNAN